VLLCGSRKHAKGLCDGGRKQDAVPVLLSRRPDEEETKGVTMRVLVCGGRDYADRAKVFATLDAIHAETPITMLIQGGARGADKLGFYWACERKVLGCQFNARWDLYGKRAGPIRNGEMLTEGKPDLVVAFSGGSGTANMTSQARAAGVEVREIAE
jgi:hypothetical protein